MTRPLSNPSTHLCPVNACLQSLRRRCRMSPGVLLPTQHGPRRNTYRRRPTGGQGCHRKQQFSDDRQDGRDEGRAARCTRCSGRLCAPPRVALGTPEQERWQSLKSGAPIMRPTTVQTPTRAPVQASLPTVPLHSIGQRRVSRAVPHRIQRRLPLRRHKPRLIERPSRIHAAE